MYLLLPYKPPQNAVVENDTEFITLVDSVGREFG